MIKLAQAIDWLATRQTLWSTQLVELANMNSGSSNLPGLKLVSQWLSEWSIGTACEQVFVQPRTEVQDDGSLRSVETGPCLMWTVRPEAPTRVLLGIHYDTVYSPDHHPDRCRWESPEKLIGPGVADAKGGIIVARAALEAIELFELAPNVGWTLFFNSDEEVGSPSSTELWTKLAQSHTVGLLFEPALSSGALVSHRKGSGNFTVVVHGKAAHAGRDFDQGRNAIALASRLTVELDNLNSIYPGVTINVGRIGGGGAVNVVPDLAVVRFNIRVPDPAGQTWVESQIRQIDQRFQSVEGYKLEWHGKFSAPAKPLDLHQKILMQQLESAAQSVGQSLAWNSSGGVCDGNRLAADGLANIDTLGPVGDRIHSPDEWVNPLTIVTKAQLVASFFARL
jgi:glutamate carboxypeptidase